MPVLRFKEILVASRYGAQGVLKREEQSAAEEKTRSPWIIMAFVVPFFVVLIGGPFLCIWFTGWWRRRRGREIPHARRVARRWLDSVTVKLGKGDEESARRQQDKDCSICLSSLFALPVSARTSMAETSVEAEDSEAFKGEGQEILALKACDHKFHAECLTSWFLLQRFDCPLCRTIYFTQKEKDSKEKQDETETWYWGLH